MIKFLMLMMMFDFNYVEHTNNEDSVVKVKAYITSHDGSLISAGGGSAVAVHSTEDHLFLVTAAHVIDEQAKLQVIDPKGITHNALLVIVKESSDLAVLMIKKTDNIKILSVYEDVPTGGMEVECLGWGPNLQDKIRHWTVKTCVGTGERTGTFIDGPFIHGDSGGAVLHDGKLMGIILSGQSTYMGSLGTLVGPGKACSLSGLKLVVDQAKRYKFDF